MTDKEYAAVIYRHVVKVADDGGDAHTRGIMRAVDTLFEREQLVLNEYYRHGKTLRQIGEEIGLTGAKRRADREKGHQEVASSVQTAGYEHGKGGSRAGYVLARVNGYK